MKRLRVAAVGVVALVLTLCAAAGAGPEAVRTPSPLPWEVWLDPASLARHREDDRISMGSSYCPGGCRYDRHSPGQSRFLRFVGDEGVIFEQAGAGAVTRIWMTMGSGIAEALDPEISIRITIDGAAEPVVDLPLPDFFGGEVAPFKAPLVGDMKVAGGGNICYVPIPFRMGCRVSLVGAGDKKIWYQVTGHSLATPDGVRSFSGDEDLSLWSRWLAEAEADPWSAGPYPTTSGEVALKRGSKAVIASYRDADLINGIILRAAPSAWPEVSLRLRFDGELRVEMSLADFFAVARDSTATRSLLVGATGEDDLYCYFPMPFFSSAEVELVRSKKGSKKPVSVEYAVRRNGSAPAADSGFFGARLARVSRSVPQQLVRVLDLEGRGKWVGLFAELASVDGSGELYLEGDEQVIVDGGAGPTLYGTGVEDFFGGGFYFRDASMQPQPIRRALHGMTSYEQLAGSNSATAMYRLMLTDAPTFARSLRVGLECGPTGGLPMSARFVAYYYTN